MKGPTESGGSMVEYSGDGFRFCLVPEMRRLLARLCLALLFCSFPLTASADDFSSSLPKLAPDERNTADTERLLIEQHFNTIRNYVQRVTIYELTPDSTLHLRHNGIKIETDFDHGMTSELEANDDGEVKLTFKFSF